MPFSPSRQGDPSVVSCQQLTKKTLVGCVFASVPNSAGFLPCGSYITSTAVIVKDNGDHRVHRDPSMVLWWMQFSRLFHPDSTYGTYHSIYPMI